MRSEGGAKRRVCGAGITLGVAVLLSGLAGCSLPQAKQPSLAYVAPAQCSNDRQCQAMWAAAPGDISRLTGMKVRIQTDSYIETFDGSRQGRLFGRVSFGPHNNGGYVVVPYVVCGADFCEHLARDAETLFNQSMKLQGLPFAQAAEAESLTFTRTQNENSVSQSKGSAAKKKQSQAIADELQKLADLKDRGVLTQAEFDTAKRRLLSQ